MLSARLCCEKDGPIFAGKREIRRRKRYHLYEEKEKNGVRDSEIGGLKRYKGLPVDSCWQQVT